MREPAAVAEWRAVHCVAGERTSTSAPEERMVARSWWFFWWAARIRGGSEVGCALRGSEECGLSRWVNWIFFIMFFTIIAG